MRSRLFFILQSKSHWKYPCIYIKKNLIKNLPFTAAYVFQAMVMSVDIKIDIICLKIKRIDAQ